MVHHKVRPGITGWAHVNGLRGETETVDKMQAWVEYDLEYLRNGSLAFDLRIIARTLRRPCVLRIAVASKLQDGKLEDCLCGLLHIPLIGWSL